MWSPFCHYHVSISLYNSISLCCRISLYNYLSLCDACLDEVHEEWVRMQDGGGVFGMELGADEPFFIGQFHNFHKVAFRITSYALHAMTLKLVKI